MGNFFENMINAAGGGGLGNIAGQVRNQGLGSVLGGLSGSAEEQCRQYQQQNPGAGGGLGSVIDMVTRGGGMGSLAQSVLGVIGLGNKSLRW
ncbi:MAG: hypothetical protein J6Z41_00635 [Prevotella sp.]|jgi:hypothetical protein|nr:hypothetical protein [Prevotella sp.]